MKRRYFISKTAKSCLSLALASSVTGLQSGCETNANKSDFDIIIKNGLVYDGTLSNPRIIDVGIRGDKITSLGRLEGNADKVINADGFAVAPGFIDVHTHCDLTFLRSGWKRHLSYILPSWKGNYNYLYQGVTTTVTGNCGYGYTDLNAWYDITDTVKFGTNVYHLVPHGALRKELFGENQPVALSSSQMAAMKKRLTEELEKGAIGFSTGLIYAPGYLASTDELIELNKVVAKHNKIYASHIRGETAAHTQKGFVVSHSIKEAIEIGKQAETPVQISHLKIAAPINDQNADLVIEPIQKARNQGLPVTADQYPYDAGATTIVDLLPKIFKTFDGIKEDYKTKEGKKSICKAISDVFVHLKPEKIYITMYSEMSEYEGKNLKEIADLESRSPAESYADMVCADSNPSGLFFSQDMDIVKAIASHDFVMTASDGWTVPKDVTHPHPRTYGTFSKKIRQFVNEDKILSLTSAIRSMTSLPAETFGLKQRGRIAKDYYADIVIFDPIKITDKATYFDPHQYSEGVSHLLVNGEISIEHGKATGNRAGRSIRA